MREKATTRFDISGAGSLGHFSAAQLGVVERNMQSGQVSLRLKIRGRKQ
jgi:hypothetical protein